MVEKQIEVVVLATHLERILAADERKAFAEFKDERSEMVQEAALEFPLGHVWI
jgi:hypothetical protein